MKMLKKNWFTLALIFIFVGILSVIFKQKQQSLIEVNNTDLPKTQTEVIAKPTNLKSPNPSTIKVNQTGQPEIKIEETYYQIYGSTAQELRQQMNQLGPEDYDGYTSWYVRWNYHYQEQNQQCRINSVRVNTDIKIILPAWQKPTNINPQLANQWSNYLHILTLHEYRHKQHGIDASYAIFNKLNSFPAYPSCNQLEQEANRASHDLINYYSQQDVIYDQDTNHGATEGAIFP